MMVKSQHNAVWPEKAQNIMNNGTEELLQLGAMWVKI